jgi:NTE family protein
VSNVLPVNVAKELGADVLIAVDVLGSGEAFKREPITGMAMTMRAAMALLRQTALSQREIAHIVIEPKIAHIRPDQMNKREELMRLGQEAALEKIDEIKSIL